MNRYRGSARTVVEQVQGVQGQMLARYSESEDGCGQVKGGEDLVLDMYRGRVKKMVQDNTGGAGIESAP